MAKKAVPASLTNHHHTMVVDTEGRMPRAFTELVAKRHNAPCGRWENAWASEATSVVVVQKSEDIVKAMTYALTIW